MSDETATQPEVPADDRAPDQSDDRAQEPSRGQKIKAGAAKAIIGVGDWLNKPVKNKVKDYKYKNNGQMIAGRVGTAFDWTVDSATKPIEAAADAFANNKFEDLLIGVPMAMADQLLAILEGLNNWIKNIERHPELGQIRDNNDATRNLNRPENTDQQTQNLAKPDRTDDPTRNLGNDGKSDSQAQGRTSDGQTGNIPAPTAGREGEQPTQTNASVGSTLSNLSATTGKIADATMKVSAFVAPVIPEAAAVTGVAATVKAVAQKGQQIGETLDPATPQANTPPVNAPQAKTPPAKTPATNAPTITQKGNSNPPTGIKLNNVAAFFFPTKQSR